MKPKSLFAGAFLLITALLSASPGLKAQTRPLRSMDYSGIVRKNGDADPERLSSDELYELAVAHEEMQSYEKALVCYGKYFSRDTSQVYVLSDLARVSTETGRIREAIAYLERAVETRQEDFYLNFRLANAYFAAGDYLRAVSTCQKLLRQGHDNARVWTLLGDCSLAFGEIEFALDEYYQAWSKNPINRTAALRYLNILAPIGKYHKEEYEKKAVEMCDSVLAYYGFEEKILQHKAITLYKLKEHKEADKAFDALLEQVDSTATTIRMAGLNREACQRDEDALELLDMAYRADTLDFPVLMGIASCYIRLNRPDEAESFLDKAEQSLDPRPNRLYTLEAVRGNLYLTKKEKEKAVHHYYKAYKYNPNATDVLLILYNLHPYKKGGDKWTNARGLWALYFYIDKLFELRKPVPYAKEYAAILDRYLEEAFFEGKTELFMYPPQSRAATVSVEKVKEMSDRLKEQ